MSSREIIIDLIDKKIINGEQAFTLINDLLKAEMLEAWETLNASKQDNKSYLTELERIWVNPNSTTYAISGTNTSNV